MKKKWNMRNNVGRCEREICAKVKMHDKLSRELSPKHAGHGETSHSYWEVARKAEKQSLGWRG